MNLAQLLGPVVGGAIYQAGGFYLPFVAMGALQCFMGLISLIFLPKIISKLLPVCSEIVKLKNATMLFFCCDRGRTWPLRF